MTPVLCWQGGWAADLKHGLGKKVYANGDVYEGLWRHGKAEGPGRYRWRNSNEYDGQWLAGRMHGQGTLIWAKGAALGKVRSFHWLSDDDTTPAMITICSSWLGACMARTPSSEPKVLPFAQIKG